MVLTGSVVIDQRSYFGCGFSGDLESAPDIVCLFVCLFFFPVFLFRNKGIRTLGRALILVVSFHSSRTAR